MDSNLATQESRIEEAIRRLEYLTHKKGLMSCVLERFKKNKKIYYSDNVGICGALYWFEEDNCVPKEWINKVKEFEEKYNATVYHITHEHTQFGELLDLFYVCRDSEEWCYDTEDLKDNMAMVYTINLNQDCCSDFGSIGYRVKGGGLVRVC